MIRKIFKNQLLAGSAVLFAGSSLASFGNYLFHLLMGRMLGPVDYGVLASLISLTYWFGVPMGALGLVVVKYVSSLRGKKEFGKIASFYLQLNKKLLIFTIAGFFFLAVVSPYLVSFLHLDSALPVWLVIASSLVGAFSTVNNAALQGFLRFGLVSVLGVVGVGLRLGMAVLLVFLGWKVLGAVLAILVASLTGCLLLAFFAGRLLKKLKKEERGIMGWEVVRYAIPVFFSTLALTSLYSTDIILARHFLPAEAAGYYSALATLGKIVFFASSPIVTVMFPIVSEHHANGKKYLNLLNLSLGLVVLASLGITTIYFLFPELMIRILFGAQYLPAAPWLALFAVFLSLYSLSSLLINFFLSIKRVKAVALPVGAAVLQVVLICFFHQSLGQIVGMSIFASGLLTVGLFGYFFLNRADF